jgi:predicted RNA-binding Zn ribbon-like protein
MKKTVSALLTAVALLLALSLPTAAQNQDNVKLQRVRMDRPMEKHPEIHAAIRHLREAKQNLEHAAHDFGGHRAKALEHVNQALEECEAALNFDRK